MSDPTAPKKQTRNDRAREAGIPRWLRRYNARYSKAGLDGLLACHLQNPAPMLDNARDRALKHAEGYDYGKD